ncbi:MAG TPA: zinc-dependent metalloprotease [Candidatus Baltobacteraceae bacterium]|nr:zinc-dependent metalloprotease [Candidatus Baltobacteraceae bacterium]
MKHLAFIGVLAAFSLSGAIAPAQPAPSAPPHAAGASLPPPSSALIPYAKFTAGATAQHGLFTIWRKDGSVAIELRPDQFDSDFVELGVPVNGIGSGGLFSGLTDLQNCRIVRFVKQDNRVAILFPTTRFLALPNTPEAGAVAAGTANTVAGVAKVLSVDEKTGDVVFDASPLLQDITNVADFLTDLNGGRLLNPMGAYRLDPMQTYFGETKAFPDNVVLVANQTFSTLNPKFINAVPDGRSLQIRLQYNIAALPQNDGYVPRYYDDRVGYFVNAHQDFSSDNTFNKDANYIVRWNIQPSDPAKRVSPAKAPIVYYLSNTIPVRYRPAVRKALLTWNKAFLPLGISNAVEVKDQPNDPNFDPDDIRYNVIRWLAEEEGGFAEAQLLYNPYTGEMIKSGVVIDSDLMRFGKFDYPVRVQADPGPGGLRSAMGDDYSAGERAQFSYGMAALSIMGGESGYYVPDKFANEFLESIVLHESGHDFGLRHNYIGSQAYTAAQLRSPAFTQRYGVATSVMEYSPLNIWPKGHGQGEYFQTVLGPYDYYVIHWGYAPVAGAKTPQQERSTLSRWASQWSNPRYSWSSDEDTFWASGAAVDPRNQQWDLTNDNIGWCSTQMQLAHSLIGKVDRRFPRTEGSFDDLRAAFGSLIGEQGRCAQIVGRYIGGEYVARSKRGDSRASLPLSPIPKSMQLRAFRVLEDNLFSSKAWDFSPYLLRQAVTQYRYDDWNGNLPERHDIAIEEIAARDQYLTISRMFMPVTLQRLDDMQYKYGHGKTMDITDLFTWMQSAAFDDISHPKGGNIPLVRRNLQRNYASLLSTLAEHPWPGTPQDAQALARYELKALHEQIQASLHKNSFDLITKAHLASLDDDVERGLHSQAVVPAGLM